MNFQFENMTQFENGSVRWSICLFTSLKFLSKTKMKIFLGFVLLVIFLAKNVNSFDNDDKEQVGTYTNLKDPFRSQKVNLLWNKARWD